MAHLFSRLWVAVLGIAPACLSVSAQQDSATSTAFAGPINKCGPGAASLVVIVPLTAA